MKQVIVAFTGAGSGSGKTALICDLVARFRRAAAVKVCEGGAALVTDDPARIMVKGKDTWRMKKAGALRVVLVSGPDGRKKALLRKALLLARGCSPVFVEGSAALGALKPDLAVFVDFTDGKEGKPGSEALRGRSGLVVRHGDGACAKIARIVGVLMEGGKRGELMKRILAAMTGGQVSCPAARAAAARAGTPAALVGGLCDETGIRVSHCALGCFGGGPGGGRRDRPLAPPFTVRSKLWIEQKGRLVIGDGRARLLRGIEQEGSLSGAARRCRLSYRRAWSMVHSIEERTGRKVIDTAIGGKTGGGSALTPYGRKLLGFYEKVCRKPMIYDVEG